MATLNPRAAKRRKVAEVVKVPVDLYEDILTRGMDGRVPVGAPFVRGSRVAIVEVDQIGVLGAAGTMDPWLPTGREATIEVVHDEPMGDGLRDSWRFVRWEVCGG